MVLRNGGRVGTEAGAAMAFEIRFNGQPRDCVREPPTIDVGYFGE
jgi:hypothetical protein